MAACVYFGVHVTARAQWIMSVIEVGILVVFAGLRAVPRRHDQPRRPRTSRGSGSASRHLTGQGVFVGAALIAAFYYWGWDVSSNLNEETKDGHKSAGAAGLIGVGIVFVLFEVFTIATLIMLPQDEIEANSANILSVLGDVIWPGIGGKILIIAVALSTIATLETTLIQVTRTLFAMGRDHTIPSAFGRVSPRWKTPAFATLVILGVSLLLFVGSNFLGSVGEIMDNAILSIGLQIAFYYTLAGVAVVVAYRRVLLQSVKNFILIGLWPASGAVFMGWAFFVSIPSNDPIVNWLGIGLIVLGVRAAGAVLPQGEGLLLAASAGASGRARQEGAGGCRPALARAGRDAARPEHGRGEDDRRRLSAEHRDETERIAADSPGIRSILCFVPVVGLEPTRPHGQPILSRSRLPFRHTGPARPRTTIP